jgi:hypothetical protein
VADAALTTQGAVVVGGSVGGVVGGVVGVVVGGSVGGVVGCVVGVGVGGWGGVECFVDGAGGFGRDGVVVVRLAGIGVRTPPPATAPPPLPAAAPLSAPGNPVGWVAGSMGAPESAGGAAGTSVAGEVAGSSVGSATATWLTWLTDGVSWAILAATTPAAPITRAVVAALASTTGRRRIGRNTRCFPR